MEPALRIDLDEVFRGGRPVIVDLGAGPTRTPGRIAVDRVDLPHIDILADIEDGLPFLPDGRVDEIHSRSVLEHVENFEHLLREIVRVLKPDGKAYIFVPHFSNPYGYSDYTHKRFFGLYSFYYFVDPERQLKRKVPTFYTDIRIDIHSLHLVFKSPFRFRHRAKRLAGRLFNARPWLQELYEEMFCHLCPCDGIEVVFSPA